ncbi:MAG TPA: hypothetical protein VK125_01020 [Bacillota bacterium]|nr:hypothetical protein [Bacillota bacterium]
MNNFIQLNEVNIFITLELLMALFIICFLFMRYFFPEVKQRIIFMWLFACLLLLEVLLVIYLYRSTGQVTTLQVVIVLFIGYALTFGLNDFKKLDRYLKMKIGKWRGIQLLTDEEIWEMELAKHPKVVARKNRRWWYSHAAIFIVAHFIFWYVYGDNTYPLTHYLTDISWWTDGNLAMSPFNDLLILQVSQLWTVIFVVDTIVSWSHTLFPDKK